MDPVMPNIDPIQAFAAFNAAVVALIEAEDVYLCNASVPEDWLEEEVEYVDGGFEIVIYPSVLANRESLPRCRKELRGSALKLRQLSIETGHDGFFWLNSVVGRILELTTQLQEPAHKLIGNGDVPHHEDLTDTYSDLEGRWTPTGRKSRLLFDSLRQRIEDSTDELKCALVSVLRKQDESIQVEDLSHSSAATDSRQKQQAVRKVGPKKSRSWLHDADENPPDSFCVNGRPGPAVFFNTIQEMGYALHGGEGMSPRTYEKVFSDKVKLGKLWIRASREVDFTYEAFPVIPDGASNAASEKFQALTRDRDSHQSRIKNYGNESKRPKRKRNGNETETK